MNGKNASEIQTAARINARYPVHDNASAKPPTWTKARKVKKNKPMVAQRKKRHMLLGGYRREGSHDPIQTLLNNQGMKTAQRPHHPGQHQPCSEGIEARPWKSWPGLGINPSRSPIRAGSSIPGERLNPGDVASQNEVVNVMCPFVSFH